MWKLAVATASLLLTLAIAILVRVAVLLVAGDAQKRAEGGGGDRASTRKAPCHVAVFLGSGGHTTEMIQLLQALPSERYTSRTYIVSRGDQFSIARAREAEAQMQRQRQRHDLTQGTPAPSESPQTKAYAFASAKETSQVDDNEGEETAPAPAPSAEDASASPAIDVLELPRARRVHQAWISTPLSVLLAFTACVDRIVLRPVPRARHRASIRHQFADVVLMNGPGTCVPLVAAIWILRVRTRA